jgi:hAT family C-terminal dimerisation region
VLVSFIAVNQMDPYDSDSSDGGPEFPSQSLPFNDPNYETYKRGQQFMIVDHTATLPCPAMSTECERVFSSAKKLITPERNQLEEDIIEACECLKAWWRNSLEQQSVVLITCTGLGPG